MTHDSGAQASDAPRRAPGTRTRSGNAMLRTRAAVLTAAAELIAADGLRATTMGSIAAAGGVAKATLYNHFRTKGDVLAALVDSRVAALGAAASEVAVADGLAAALEHAAAALADEPALRRLAADEPSSLLPLLAPGPARGWSLARAEVAAVLSAARAPTGPGEVELVLRLLVSHVLWPAAPEQARTDAAAVTASLSGSPPAAVPAVPAVPALPASSGPQPAPRHAPTAPDAGRSALGWPC